MTRIALPRTLRLAVLTVVALVGIAACSSDSNKTSVDDLSTIDVSLPDVDLPSVTLPPGVTLPPNISDDCRAIYLKYVTAMTSAYMPTAQVDYDEVFGDLSASIPGDLQDDLAVVAAAFQEYGAILATNNNDTSSPEVQQAIQALATDEVNDASNNLQDYFEATCPQV